MAAPRQSVSNPMASRGEFDTAQRKSLTKNTLQMKFMQRTRSALITPIELKKKQVIDEDHWVLPGIQEVAAVDTLDFDPSYIACADLLPLGRMSFLGYNPATEKTHAEILRRRQHKLSKDKEDFEGVSDEEMARRYDSLVDTIGDKFKSKNKRKRSSKALDDRFSDDDNDDDVPGDQVVAEKQDPIQKLLKKPKLPFKKPKDD